MYVAADDDAPAVFAPYYLTSNGGGGAGAVSVYMYNLVCVCHI